MKTGSIRKWWWVLFPLLLFFVLHMTPKMAIRTHLIMLGHPITAFTAELPINSSREGLMGYYELPKDLRDWDTEERILGAHVERRYFLYFADITTE